MWHIHGEARDLSRLIPRHPGGADILLQMRGRDCTVLYETYHPQRPGRREGAWREATAVLRGAGAGGDAGSAAEPEQGVLGAKEEIYSIGQECGGCRGLGGGRRAVGPPAAVLDITATGGPPRR